MTDEHKAYHSKGEDAKEGFTDKRGEERSTYKIHTNTIEGYWVWVKRGICGIHYWVREKHMQKCLNNYLFKYNTKGL